MSTMNTNPFLKSLLAILLYHVLPASAAESPALAEKANSPQALKAEIEALKPAQFAWQEIHWKTCLLEALKGAREKKKPVLLWVVGPGEALDGRC